VCALPGFADDPNHSNEKILEAIQMTWIEEHD
jgi:FeS assembly protein IscX